MENIEIIILIAVIFAVIFLFFKILKHVIMLSVLIYIVYAVGIIDTKTIDSYDSKWGVSTKLSEWNKELGFDGAVSSFFDDSNVGGSIKEKAKCLTKEDSNC
jgi:hypothetical protein